MQVEKVPCVKITVKNDGERGVKCTSGGHMIKIDHGRCRAVMSAVYLADNKHMVRETNDCGETEDHNVHSSNARRYSNS